MMIDPQPQGRRFSDNVIIFGLAAGQIISFGVLFHSFSLFVKPMQAEFGWTVTQMSGAFTLGLFCADIFGIPVGHWVDRYGGRLAMSLGATLAAILLLLWSQIDSLIGFYAIWVAIGFAQSMSLGNVTASVVTANTRDFRRGLTWVAILSGFSSITVVPVASVAVAWWGWRGGLVTLAVLQFLGPALIYMIILRGTVGSRTLEFARRAKAVAEGRPTSVSGGESPLATALRRPAFWLLAVACSVHWFVITGVLVHFLPLMQERQVAPELAVAVFAFNGPAAVVGRLVLYLLDPTASAGKTGRIAFPVFALGILILIYGGPLGLWGLAAFALVYGMAAGVIMIVRQTAIAEIFGIRGYGAITGALTTACIIPRTVAPLSIAMMRDSFGSYEPVLWILFGLILVATVAFWLAMAGRPRSS
jgi:MFS family permease